MRSISQYVASWLNDKTFDQKRAFYRNFMRRPDDVAEIFAVIDMIGQKRSHALVKGGADYLATLNNRTLAKYKLASREYNMYDLINLTHAHSRVIDDYKADVLEIADTWETKIATAEDATVRDQEWKRLVEEHKLGYMALIRNLNNILNSSLIDAEWVQTVLCPQIVNEQAIRGSLMFPYRFFTAYTMLTVRNLDVISALGRAFQIAAVYNAPQLEKNSAIILDVSGSMEDPISARSQISIKEVGACFAVSLWLANKDCPIIKFGNRAKIVQNFSPLDNPFDLIAKLCANDNCGYGTDIIPAFQLLASVCGHNFERIFVISDMQVMDDDGYWGPRRMRSAAQEYRAIFQDTTMYSFDLGHYHTQLLSPQENIHYVTALNDQVFKFIGLLESGIDIVEYINSCFSYC